MKMETSALYTEPSAAIHKKEKSSWRMKTLIFPDYLREDIHFFHQKMYGVYMEMPKIDLSTFLFSILILFKSYFPQKVRGAGLTCPVFVGNIRNRGLSPRFQSK
jgi:hypothetical protein